jgi:hypothetical protein
VLGFEVQSIVSCVPCFFYHRPRVLNRGSHPLLSIEMHLVIRTETSSNPAFTINTPRSPTY